MKKLGAVTDNLNKALDKALENFAYNTEWTDINNWLLSLEAIFRDNPSPFINEKVMLSKRLNQCINPILPDKVHECVLRVHQLIFLNMRASVENNINEYVKLFANDLGTYLILFRNLLSFNSSIFYPYFGYRAPPDCSQNAQWLLFGSRSWVDSYADGDNQSYPAGVQPDQLRIPPAINVKIHESTFEKSRKTLRNINNLVQCAQV